MNSILVEQLQCLLTRIHSAIYSFIYSFILCALSCRWSRSQSRSWSCTCCNIPALYSFPHFQTLQCQFGTKFFFVRLHIQGIPFVALPSPRPSPSEVGAQVRKPKPNTYLKFEPLFGCSKIVLSSVPSQLHFQFTCTHFTHSLSPSSSLSFYLALYFLEF